MKEVARPERLLLSAFELLHVWSIDGKLHQIFDSILSFCHSIWRIVNCYGMPRSKCEYPVYVQWNNDKKRKGGVRHDWVRRAGTFYAGSYRARILDEVRGRTALDVAGI